MSEIAYSVIIPSVRPAQALNTISALKSQVPSGNQYEIILVTPLATADVNSLNGVKVVETGKTFPPGRNRNIGAEKASGQILLFIDDDCVPPPNWIESMVGILEKQPDVAEVGCRVKYSDESFWGRCADYCLFGAYQYEESGYQDLGSAAIAVKADAWRMVRGMDEELLASEDWDLSLKLRQNERKCYFNSGITVQHNHDKTSFGALIRSAYRSGWRSGLVVQRRYHHRLTWLAKLSVSMGHPLLYWILILPYALLVTLSYWARLLKYDPYLIAYAPFMLLCQISYHFGVWCRLCKDKLR